MWAAFVPGFVQYSLALLSACWWVAICACQSDPDRFLVSSLLVFLISGLSNSTLEGSKDCSVHRRRDALRQRASQTEPNEIVSLATHHCCYRWLAATSPHIASSEYEDIPILDLAGSTRPCAIDFESCANLRCSHQSLALYGTSLYCASIDWEQSGKWSPLPPYALLITVVAHPAWPSLHSALPRCFNKLDPTPTNSPVAPIRQPLQRYWVDC